MHLPLPDALSYRTLAAPCGSVSVATAFPSESICTETGWPAGALRAVPLAACGGVPLEGAASAGVRASARPANATVTVFISHSPLFQSPPGTNSRLPSSLPQPHHCLHYASNTTPIPKVYQTNAPGTSRERPANVPFTPKPTPMFPAGARPRLDGRPCPRTHSP